MSIELNIFPEHPEETSGSPSEKTETGRRKIGNADKGIFSTGDEQEKQATTTKKEVRQNLQTGDINMSSESGALKKSGAVRVVRASIHERPKKTRGSISEEKNRVSQATLHQEIRETGNANAPLESEALKKSEAVDFVLVTFHEHPKGLSFFV